MPYSSTDISAMIEASTAKSTVTVTFNGVEVGTFRAKFRRKTEVVSPNDIEVSVVKPSFLCDESDINDYTRDHRFTVALDNGATGIENAKMYGNPSIEESGLARVVLTK